MNTPTRVMLTIAGLLTILSMAWTAWSVLDLLGFAPAPPPLPIAVAVAIAVELAWVSVVTAEWQHIRRTGTVPRALAWTGWGIATVTVAILALHAALTTPLLLPLALLPFAAKTLWAWALADVAATVRARLASEKTLSTDLTESQQAELAELRREAAYVRARADAERDLADAEHQRRLEIQRRAAAERMNADRSHADILRQRNELARELEMSRPLALPGGDVPVAPPDLSTLGVVPPNRQPFGFAATPVAAMADTPGGHPGGPTATTTGDTSSDLDENQAATPGDAPGGWWPDTPATGNRQRVLDAITLYGPDVSTRQLADELGLARSTVRQHRMALAEAGHQVYTDDSTTG